MKGLRNSLFRLGNGIQLKGSDSSLSRMGEG
jgi:hypothetical protein